MNTYALIRRTKDAETIVAKVEAGTQGQACRRLYRANRIKPEQAEELGFAVEFQKPETKGAKSGHA